VGPDALRIANMVFQRPLVRARARIIHYADSYRFSPIG